MGQHGKSGGSGIRLALGMSRQYCMANAEMVTQQFRIIHIAKQQRGVTEHKMYPPDVGIFYIQMHGDSGLNKKACIL